MLGAVLAVVLVTHRNSGDVGAAADLADARRIVEQRAQDGDGFDALDRGRFVEEVTVDVHADQPDSLVRTLEHGHFGGDGAPALRLELAAFLGTGMDNVTVEMEHLDNGLTVVFPGGCGEVAGAASAALSDLRSGRPVGCATVEQPAGEVVIPLPPAFTADRGWSYTVTGSLRPCPPPGAIDRPPCIE